MDYDNLRNDTYDIIFREFGELCYKNSFLESILKRLLFHGLNDEKIITQKDANILWHGFENSKKFKKFTLGQVGSQHRQIFQYYFNPHYLNSLDDYTYDVRNDLTHNFAMISVFDTRWDENKKRNVLKEKKNKWQKSYHKALQAINDFIKIALEILQGIEIKFEFKGIAFNYYK